jgi:hypothetical protein
VTTPTRRNTTSIVATTRDFRKHQCLALATSGRTLRATSSRARKPIADRDRLVLIGGLVSGRTRRLNQPRLSERNRARVTRWSKKPEDHLALLMLVCGLIAFKQAHAAALPG